MIKAGINKIAVKLNEFYSSTIGTDGFKIDILVESDNDMMKTKYISTGAEIVSPPSKVEPVPHPYNEDAFHYYDEFLEYLKKSTHIYFDFKSLEEEEYVKDEDGNRIYFVPIHLTFCATDEKSDTQRIFPNTNVTLCKPFYGFGYQNIELPDGSSVFGKMSPSGIITDTNPIPDERIAVVAHADMQSDLGEGDIVFREPKTNYEYEIAGEKFYVVNTELIMGVFKGTSFGHKISDDVRDEYQYDIDATEDMGEMWGEEYKQLKDSIKRVNENQYFFK